MMTPRPLDSTSAYNLLLLRPTIFMTTSQGDGSKVILMYYRVGRNLVTDHAGGGGVVPTAKAINPTI